MANRYTDAVFHAQGIPLTEKAILWALAHRTNNDTGECFPSIALIALDSGASERTVTRTMKSLLQMGLVKITGKRRYKGGHAHNVYQVNLTRLKDLAPGQSDPDMEVNSASDRGQADEAVGQVDPQSGSLRPDNSSFNSEFNSKENSSINSVNSSIDGSPSEKGQKQKNQLQRQNQNQPRYAIGLHHCSKECQPPCEARFRSQAKALEGLSQEEKLEFWSELLVIRVIAYMGRSDLYKMFGKMVEKARVLVEKHEIDIPQMIIEAALDGHLDSPGFEWSRIIRDASNPMAMACSKFDYLDQLFDKRGGPLFED